MNNKTKAHLALLSVALIYGINYSVAKDVMDGHIGPRGFILLRIMGAALLFWLFNSWGKPQKIAFKDYGLMALCGLFGVALNQMTFFEGLNLTTPINASIIMTVSPIIVLGLSVFAFGEKLTFLKILGIVIGGAGAVYLIAGNKSLSLLESHTAMGNLLVLVNAASFSTYLVLVKPLMAKYNALTVVKWVFLFGLLLATPFGYHQLLEAQWQSMDIVIVAEIAFVVVCTTFLAYLLNMFALKTVSSTTVSMYIYLQPVFATLIAFSIGADSLTWSQFTSALCIFTGVYLVSYKRKIKKPKS